MDVIVNPDFVRALRQERGWSQEQLAEVSGVSLRTIQRVERDGNCSLETRNALGAAFDRPGAELETGVDSERDLVTIKKQIRHATWGVCIGLGGAALFMILDYSFGGLPAKGLGIGLGLIGLGFGLSMSLLGGISRYYARKSVPR